MGIRNIPQSYEAMKEYLHTFEKSKMRYAKSNTDVLVPVLNFILSRCKKSSEATVPAVACGNVS